LNEAAENAQEQIFLPVQIFISLANYLGMASLLNCPGNIKQFQGSCTFSILPLMCAWPGGILLSFFPLQPLVLLLFLTLITLGVRCHTKVYF
jgi:hypothetical protein